MKTMSAARNIKMTLTLRGRLIRSLKKIHDPFQPGRDDDREKQSEDDLPSFIEHRDERDEGEQSP